MLNSFIIIVYCLLELQSIIDAALPLIGNYIEKTIKQANWKIIGLAFKLNLAPLTKPGYDIQHTVTRS